MTELQRIKISKYLCLILRHKPQKIGLELDKNAWAGTEELLQKLNINGTKLSLDELKEVVKNDNKQRFSFSEDYEKIRANQGHSLDVDLGLAEQEPPEFLYHGTTERNINSIKENGLNKITRHHVHLSVDTETALNVGKRYGKPIVLTVKAKEMFDAGKTFYLSENGVWLTDFVELDYILF